MAGGRGGGQKVWRKKCHFKVGGAGTSRKKASEVQELAGLEEAAAEREELLDPRYPQAGVQVCSLGEDCGST